MDAKSDTPDAAAARIAARQHGVLTRRQLEDCGLGSKAITIRVRKGQLHRVHQGVYTMKPPPLSVRERFMAAVLACGPQAVVSHVSAAVLWELLKPIDGPVHVSVPTASGRRSRPGIHVHRRPSLSTPAQPSSSPTYLHQEGGRGGGRRTTRRHNIPVTTVPRTVEDLRTSRLLPPHLLRRAIRQAELKGHRLEGVESDRTRSDLEALFLNVIQPRRDRIPSPEVNVKLGRYEVDFFWRRHHLVVEIDSYTYHRGSVAFHSDHARDLDLRSAGYTVLRFDDAQLEDEPQRVAADVAAALAMSGTLRG
jgi:very-short-patch-repair endonuclease